MLVTVHNISDRPNTPGGPVMFLIGRQQLRPGKHMQVDDGALNMKLRALHGTRIWIGDLPRKFTRTAASAYSAEVEPAVSPRLSLEEVRAYLERFTEPDLLELAQLACPPVSLHHSAKAAMISRLSRALMQGDRELDPEYFFWLGRWARVPGGFVPVE